MRRGRPQTPSSAHEHQPLFDNPCSITVSPNQRWLLVAFATGPKLAEFRLADDRKRITRTIAFSRGAAREITDTIPGQQSHAFMSVGDSGEVWISFNGRSANLQTGAGADAYEATFTDAGLVYVQMASGGGGATLTLEGKNLRALAKISLPRVAPDRTGPVILSDSGRTLALRCHGHEVDMMTTVSGYTVSAEVYGHGLQYHYGQDPRDVFGVFDGAVR